MPLTSGTRLGLYEITDLLGAGGRGEVYRARFLMIKDNTLGDQTTTPASMVVVLNWFEELKARAGRK